MTKDDINYGHGLNEYLYSICAILLTVNTSLISRYFQIVPALPKYLYPCFMIQYIHTYILDVLCRQRIKLFQVVSTSEFHEY